MRRDYLDERANVVDGINYAYQGGFPPMALELRASFALDEKLRDLLKEAADRRGESASVCVRRAVAEFVARELGHSEQHAPA